MYVVDFCLEVCNSRYHATLESDILLKSVNDSGYATTPSLEHPYFPRTMFRFSTPPDLRLLAKVCMTKGEDVHGPESDRCSRANQILLGSYWGRSMHTISSGPTRDRTHSHPPPPFWPVASGLGFPAESPTASSPRLVCLLSDSASIYQTLRFLEQCRDMIILICRLNV